MESQPVSLPPFTPQFALNKDRLDLTRCVQEVKGRAATTSTPTSSSAVLQHLPGEPRVPLEASEVHDFLTRELSTPIIDELYPWLWLVATKAGDNVSSLHRSRIKGTEILPAEDPKLHLVWDHQRVYIKPMPVWLLNYEVWTTFLGDSDAVRPYEAQLKSGSDRKIALGFLRSYGCLIRHPIDLKIARETGLIPEGLEIDWIQWAQFISGFARLRDDEVAKRYHFGHIRLNRLNWPLRVLQPASARSSWYYLQPHWSVAKYIESMFNYLLFSFATVSLVLSAMQVALAVPQDGLGFRPSDGYSLGLRQTFWVFSSIVLYASATLWAILLAIPVGRLSVQLGWALRTGGTKRPHSHKHDYISN